MTDMVPGGGEPSDLSDLESFSPMDRIADPMEIGEVICFLAAPNNAS